MSHESHEHHTLQDRIAALEAHAAISALQARYATAADVCLSTPSHAHAVELVALFTDDASADYGPFGTFVGRDQLIHAFENVLPAVASWSRHYVTNPAIEVHGNEAKGNWYFLVYSVLRAAPPGPPTNLFGTYEGGYVKTAAGWRIRSLVTRFVEPPR